MGRKFREWYSLQRAKNPGRVVLFVILLFNILFFLIAALVIRSLALSGTEKMGFFEAIFYTITMILDAGCISYVIEDIGQSGYAIAIVCLLIVMVGMVSFTGAVIGYVTNTISNFIENSNAGTKKLYMSDHLVILNWNTRASEIINDLLYCPGKQKVVVLTESRKEEIKKEVDERVADTINRENKLLWDECRGMPFPRKYFAYAKKEMKNNLEIVYREGDVFSSKQLLDISLDRARSVIILGADVNNTICRYGQREQIQEMSKGNSQTIKTLMQVADITADLESADDQKIIVEISDDWTWEIVDKIIQHKQVDGKCNIVPVRVNQVLGQILSQFSLMPELNLAYRELFSNKGATFYVEEREVSDDNAYIAKYLKNHKDALPLTSMKSDGKDYFFYTAEDESDIRKTSKTFESKYTVKLNRDYWIERKCVIILGHNSKCKDIMQGFAAFCEEWGKRGDEEIEILDLIVIDDEQSLKKMNYYKEYPFVKDTIAASIYDKDIIIETIDKIMMANEEDTSVLILSDDTALNENIDANALANLVYAQDIISRKKIEDPNFDEERLDLIVEIIDPKHHDIVNSYSVNNVVISNRYISKMITQIGEKEAIFDFYTDILTYDTKETNAYESKEVYAKKVSTFFEELPLPCTQAELVHAVWEASTDPSIPADKMNPTIVLGYVKPGGKLTLFSGEHAQDLVKLRKEDKIIVFTNH